MGDWLKFKGKAELINKPFPLRLKTAEKIWLEQQSEKECSNVNSIIRKAITQYRNSIESTSN